MTQRGIVFHDEISCRLAEKPIVAKLVSTNEFLSRLARRTLIEEIRATSEWFAKGGAIND